MTIGRLEYRPYKCKNCGNEQSIQTNHTGVVYHYCNNCSWKPSFGNPEYCFPYGGRTYRPFEFTRPRRRRGKAARAADRAAVRPFEVASDK